MTTDNDRDPLAVDSQLDNLGQETITVSLVDASRAAFEIEIFAYYQNLKIHGWWDRQEGDNTAASLFWRAPSGKYGVTAVEAAWNGWQMAMRYMARAAT